MPVALSRRIASLSVPVLILGVALAVRLTMIERYVPVSPWVAAQTLADAEMGRNLIEGRGWTANRVLIERARAAQNQPGRRIMVDLQDLLPVDDSPANQLSVGAAHSPGYSTWLAISYWLGGDYRYVYSQRMQAVLDAIGALLVFGIGVRCWSRTAGVIAGLGYALSPPHAFLANLTVAAATDSFWFLLTAYGTVVTAGAIKEGRSPWRGGALVALAGFCGACMNSTALVLPAVSAGAAVVIAVADRRYLRVAGVLLAAQLMVMVALTPWAVRNQQRFDQFSFVRGSFWQLAFAAWGELPNPWGLGFDDKEYWHWIDENCPACSAGQQQQAMRDFLLSEVVTTRPFPRHLGNLLALRLPRTLEVARTPDGGFQPGEPTRSDKALAGLFVRWDRLLPWIAVLAAAGLAIALFRRDHRLILLLGLAPSVFLLGFSLVFYVELRKTVPAYGCVFVLAAIAVAGTGEFLWTRLKNVAGSRATAAAVAVFCLLAVAGGSAQAPSPVAGGELHSVIANTFGQVWGWGSNLYGQLGDGAQTVRYAVNAKSLADGLANVAGVAAGSNHTLALTRDGSVWGWGDNSMGQLGLGNRRSQLRPVPIPSLHAIRAISGGYAHSLALDADGAVWSWGSNLYGQLGRARPAESLAPVRVSLPRKATAIAAGWFFSLAIDDTGRVWAWGRNTRGQLGSGSDRDVAEPVLVPGLADIRMVAAGHQHALALNREGRIWAWGANDYGQVGGRRSEEDLALPRFPDWLDNVDSGSAKSRPTTNRSVGYPTQGAVVPPRIVEDVPAASQVVAGADCAFAISAGGQAWAWGDNMYGQLGDGGFVTRSEPAPATALPPVAAIGAGHAHLTAIAQDGSLWTWGFGHFGQLGEGLTSRRLAVPRRLNNLRAREPEFDLSPGNAYVIEAAERSWMEAGTVAESRRMLIKGTATDRYTYVARAKPLFVGPDTPWRYLFAQGVARVGGITVGVQVDGKWAYQANVDSPGPFTVSWQVPNTVQATAVIAHYLPGESLESDVELSAWGWLTSPAPPDPNRPAPARAPARAAMVPVKEPEFDLRPANALLFGKEELAWTGPGTTPVARRLQVKGEAAGRYTYAAQAKPILIGPGSAWRHLFAQGVARVGGITVGVQVEGKWVYQATIESAGPFTVLWEVPSPMNATVVIAHYLPGDSLATDVEITSWGFLKSPAIRKAR